MIRWFLEGYLNGEEKTSQLPLSDFPQVLGRDENLTCVVREPSVSRSHARIRLDNDRLILEDLGSRNGTFVNRSAIHSPTGIFHGDVIHLGTAELRLIDTQHASSSGMTDGDETKFMSTSQLSEQFPTGIRELEKLIANQSVNMVFQPIIRASDTTTTGYEILGRGGSPDLPTSPLDLFRIAESFNLEIPLSECMRDKAVESAMTHGIQGELLVNTHPAEIRSTGRLIDSLRALCLRFPKAQLVLEIHEQSVVGNSALLRELKVQLDNLNIKLAFDDFGVGQSRFMEMVEAKPDLIKYDHALIHKIDQGEPSRVNLLRHLKELASELSIDTLAECVSNEGEYRVCKAMGFDYFQGFFFAKPQPPENFCG